MPSVRLSSPGMRDRHMRRQLWPPHRACTCTRTQAPCWRRQLYPRSKGERDRAPARTNPVTHQRNEPSRRPRSTPHRGIPPHRTPYRLCQLPPPAGSNPRAANATKSHKRILIVHERTREHRTQQCICTNEFTRARANPRAVRPQMKIAQTNCRCARANPRRLASLGSPHVQLESRFRAWAESRGRAGIHPLRPYGNVTFVTVGASVISLMGRRQPIGAGARFTAVEAVMKKRLLSLLSVLTMVATAALGAGPGRHQARSVSGRDHGLRRLPHRRRAGRQARPRPRSSRAPASGSARPGSASSTRPTSRPTAETGLGGWSEAEIATAIRTGVRPDGRELAPMMPWRSYAALTDEDALAVAGYLKSLPPVRHAVPPPAGPDAKAPAPYLGVIMPE